MEIKGRMFQVLEPITGESANGPWKKQEFVIETMDQYPKKINFSVWNDKIQLSSLAANAVITVYFDAESREYNGRWYTNLNAYKAEVMDANAAAEAGDIPPPPVEVEQPEEDQLPF